MSSDRRPVRQVIGGLLFVLALLPHVIHAQVTTTITPDATLPVASTVTRTGNLYDIDGGSIAGTNQFHSFGRFDVGTGDIASFNGPAGIQNILGRVTGATRSEIDGVLRSTISGANLFLVNPNGILFGPNSSLDVQGSFHATTADRIVLADGKSFNATPSAADFQLTSATPAAFGFLGSSGSIDVTAPDPFAPLQVPEGETLSLVGGTVNLGAADGSAPAYVLAPGGTINLVSVTSGTATFDGSRIDVNPSSRLGDINMQGASIVDGRNVYIRGGRFVANDAVVIPGAFFFLGLAPSPDGGEVNIDVTGDVLFTGTTFDPLIGAPSGIFAFAGDFFGFPAVPAKVPDIRIAASSVTMSGIAGVLTNKAGPGTPADVVINADTVRIENGASVTLVNLFQGPGDNLTVDTNDLELVGNGGASFTGLQTQTFFHTFYGGDFDPALTFADSGAITVNAANNVTVRNGAQITSDSRSFGSSGDISVTARNIFLSDGGGQISAKSAFAGDSGNITLNAAGSGQILIDNGFVVAATTFGSGDSGGVNLNASQSVTISGVASGIASQTAPPPVEELDAFAGIFLGAGATFVDLILALGLDPATADIFDVLDGLNAFGLTAVADLTPGDGGNINISTPTLVVSGAESAIDSSTAWNGNAGQVNVNAGSATVRGGAQIRSRSGLVDLTTGEVLVGDGLAGNININASDRVLLQSGGSISTEAITSDGGNIVVKAGNIIALFDSQITTSVQSGVGAGGNINLDPPAIILARSSVIANAFGGPGGNITIVASQFIVDPYSVVEASSALGIDGRVEVNAPDTTVAGNLVPLPRSILDASNLLRDHCGVARAAGGSSSLVAAGRGGIPGEPDGYLPSFGGGALETGVAASQTTPQVVYTPVVAGGNMLALWSQECR